MVSPKKFKKEMITANRKYHESGIHEKETGRKLSTKAIKNAGKSAGNVAKKIIKSGDIKKVLKVRKERAIQKSKSAK